MNGTTKNCHYVARSLTKPWEHERPHRNRELRYYCFKTDRIDFDSSKKLLAKHKLLTPEEEKRFSELIEMPLGNFKDKHLKSSFIDDYNIFRALFLYFMFQVERFNLVVEREGNGWNLSELLNMPDEQLNTISEDMRKKFKIVAMNTIEGHLLFFPEVGYYTFPILCSETQYPVRALALPLYSTLCLCLVPHGPTEDDLQASRNVMMQFSVGLNDNYNICLIPNELKDNDEKFIIDTIKDYRARAIDHQKQCDELDYLVRYMYASVGLNFDEVVASKMKGEKE